MRGCAVARGASALGMLPREDVDARRWRRVGSDRRPPACLIAAKLWPWPAGATAHPVPNDHPVDPPTARDHWKARRTARRSRRSATKTSAPRARSDWARSALPDTIARTGKPICKRSFVRRAAGGAADEDRNGGHIGGACYAYFSAISMPSGASGPTGMKSKSIRPAWPSGRPCRWVLAASTDSALTRNTTPGASSLNHICSMTPSR